MVSEGNWTNGTIGDEEGRTPRMVFLALIMLLACGVNVLLLFAFVHNKKARQSVQSVAVINLAAVCLGDCVLNMSLVMGSLSAGQDWTFSEPLCKWHSFVMSLVLVETSLLITVLVCDRFLAVRYLEKYDSLISSVRLIIVLVFTWVQSLAFSFPYFLDTVKTTFQLNLHTCSVSDETSLVFICMASVLCFLAPALINVVMFIRICHLSYRQKQEVKMIMTKNHYCDQVKQEPPIWKEMCTVKYVAVLCFLWFLLEIPYVITTYIQQYRLSSELSFSVDYPWGVDVAFMWMRFSFSALFPCVTFVWRKDLWHCCKEHLVCHRSNSVLDIKVTVDPTAKPASRLKHVPPAVKVPSKSKERDQPRAEVPNLLSFNVPVLFATSDGIHIETPHSDVSEAEDADIRDHKPKGRQLDITSHTGDHDHLPGETSDYDSEEEYYSSQPLSTRHIRGALETNSASNLCGEDQHERGAPANTTKLTSSQGADSGLELSGTMNSALDKGMPQEMNGSKDCSENTDGRTSATAAKHVAHVNTEANISTGDGDTDQTSNVPSYTEAIHRVSSVGPKTESRKSDKSEEGKTTPRCVPSPVPKATGRLKPLQLARPPKVRKEWPEKITMKSQDRNNDSAAASQRKPDSEAAGKADRGQEGRSADRGMEQSSAERRTDGARPSKEGRGRGHRRTLTSDSERALLSSDSSMEIQTIKVHSCKAESEPSVTKPE
ncbi:hypothetical protein ACOMHN_029141 [Nucella lapillus]